MLYSDVSLTHVAVVCFIQSEAPSVCPPPMVCADNTWLSGTDLRPSLPLILALICFLSWQITCLMLSYIRYSCLLTHQSSSFCGSCFKMSNLAGVQISKILSLFLSRCHYEVCGNRITSHIAQWNDNNPKYAKLTRIHANQINTVIKCAKSILAAIAKNHLFTVKIHHHNSSTFSLVHLKKCNI